MVYTEPIVDFLITVDPALDYGPNWMPPPDPPVSFPGSGTRITWTGVYNWVRSGYEYVFRGGNEFSQTSAQQVQTIVDAAVGQLQKALTGYMNQLGAMTVEAAHLLESEIDQQRGARVSDFNLIQQQIGLLRDFNTAMTGFVIPALQAQIADARTHADAVAAQAQRNAEQNALETIFKPLYTEMLKVQPAINDGVAKAEQVAHSDTVAQVAKLGAAVGVVVEELRGKFNKVQSWVDDCGEPMCENLGPKTDLGKLLKGLKLAGELALLAELTSLTEGDLVSVLRTVATKAGDYIGFFEQHFVSGGETIGSTITRAVASGI